ncbi:AI-2E family transporter [Ottowia testudinis]|uniref:AI-2E family transporter n=1 Tax=Ottowia testudinis TaxID=2816950 RepID=A0A975CFD1_9BURK|nr:AI-2E family transporter [Ottowia testudinis]QTD44751.1 AI-2E family transporter [Ottowia testudinis]
MNTPALQRAAFLLLLALVTVAFFWIIAPFFGAVFWAMVLALMFMPVHRRLRAWMRGRDTLAALGTLLFCLVIVVVPLIFVVGAMVDEAASFTQRLRTGEFNPRSYFEQIQNALPAWVRDLLGRFGLFNMQDVVDKLTAAVVQGGQALTTRALAIGQNTLMLLVNLGITLYLLFFFLRDGRDLARSIRSAVPLDVAHTDFLLRKFATVVRATVKGTVVVALVQGMLGGLAFAVLGIHGAVLWGVVMAFLSLLPAVGAALVWAPVAIYLAATGSLIEGIGLAAWGAGVMGMVDNVLRPILVGKETKLPDYLVLLSTIGGLSIFGLNGFVIGPAIAALFVAAWALFAAEEQAEPVPAPIVEGAVATLPDSPAHAGGSEAETDAERPF